MKYTKLIAILLIAFLLSSCEKDIPFPKQDAKPSLVLNTLFEAGEPAEIHISSTRPLTMQDVSPITDAVVTVVDNNGVKTDFTYEADGIYTAENFQVAAGKDYEITVTATNYENITASSSIPNDFDFAIIDTAYGIHEGFPTWFFDIEIEDNNLEESYYIVEVDYTYEDTSITTVDNTGLPFAHFAFDLRADNSDLLADTQDNAAGLRGLYLSNTTVENGRYTSKLGVADKNLSKDKTGKTRGNIRVRSVSKDLYEYYKSLERYRLNQGNFFAEPVQIYSNIENGVGILGAYNEKRMVLDLTP